MTHRAIRDDQPPRRTRSILDDSDSNFRRILIARENVDSFVFKELMDGRNVSIVACDGSVQAVFVRKAKT